MNKHYDIMDQAIAMGLADEAHDEESLFRAAQLIAAAEELEGRGALGRLSGRACRVAAVECILGGYTEEHASLLGHTGHACSALDGALQGPAGLPALSVTLDLALRRDCA